MIQSLMSDVLTSPYVWLFAISYFFVYVIRQGTTSWFIFYLKVRSLPAAVHTLHKQHLLLFSCVHRPAHLWCGVKVSIHSLCVVSQVLHFSQGRLGVTVSKQCETQKAGTGAVKGHPGCGHPGEWSGAGRPGWQPVGRRAVGLPDCQEQEAGRQGRKCRPKD